MRKFWISFVVALLLSSGVTLMVKYWPKTLSEEECGPLYRQYAHVPGIEASYVKGFRVNDTLTIDATLLRATDSAGWAQLREDYEVPDSLWNDTSSPKSKSITLVLRKKGQTKNVIDTNLLNNDYVAINMPEHLIGIYHITDSAQMYACIDYHLQSIVSKYLRIPLVTHSTYNE